MPSKPAFLLLTSLFTSLGQRLLPHDHDSPLVWSPARVIPKQKQFIMKTLCVCVCQLSRLSTPFDHFLVEKVENIWWHFRTWLHNSGEATSTVEIQAWIHIPRRFLLCSISMILARKKWKKYENTSISSFFLYHQFQLQKLQNEFFSLDSIS